MAPLFAAEMSIGNQLQSLLGRELRTVSIVNPMKDCAHASAGVSP